MKLRYILRHPWRWIDGKLWCHYAPDCTPLIQQLIDNGGGYIPEGRWKIEFPLSIHPGVVIRGDGIDKTVIEADDA